MSSMESAAPRLWTDRPFARIPLPPFVIGLLLAAAALMLLAGLIEVSGGFDELQARGVRWWEHRDGRLGALLALLVGTLPVAFRYHELGTSRNLEALARSNLWGAEPPPDLDAKRSESPYRAMLVGTVGLALLPIFSISIDRDPGLYLRRDYWGVAQAWHWIVGSGILFLGGIFTYCVYRDARRFGALARSLPQLDLLDRESLLPFARQGLRSAVPGLIFLTFLAPNAVDRDFWVAIVLLGGFTALQNAGMLLIPLLGLRERLSETKRDELARVNAAIRGEPNALEGSLLRRRQEPDLADLLAWRRFVESVSEWPIDTSTLGRFAFYLGIPLLGWVGAALVERMLDSVIG